MFQSLGSLCIFLPPLVVFILEVLELIGKITVSVQVLVATYPIGMLILAFYVLSYRRGGSIEHYLEFARGARTGTFLALSGSVVSAFFPVFLGVPVVGSSLPLISLGSIPLPSIAAAGAFGSTLIKTNETTLQGHRGTTHYGLMIRFLSLFLGEGGIFEQVWQDSVAIVGLFFLLILAWVLLGVAYGFALTLEGLAIVLLVPISSYRLFLKTTSLEDRSKIKDILNRIFANASESQTPRTIAPGG